VHQCNFAQVQLDALVENGVIDFLLRRCSGMGSKQQDYANDDFADDLPFHDAELRTR